VPFVARSRGIKLIVLNRAMCVCISRGGVYKARSFHLLLISAAFYIALGLWHIYHRIPTSGPLISFSLCFRASPYSFKCSAHTPPHLTTQVLSLRVPRGDHDCPETGGCSHCSIKPDRYSPFWKGNAEVSSTFTRAEVTRSFV
jgi:hypothetical protein